MASVLSRQGLRFLYRTEEGVISRALWWSGLAPLVSIMTIPSAIWIMLSPYANRGLDERAFLDPMTAAAYIFLMFFAFVTMLATVCYVMLSMKRLRARGRPPGLAGLPPLAALLAGAVHWLEPQMSGAVPMWGVYAADGVLLASIVWAIVDMGVLSDESA